MIAFLVGSGAGRRRSRRKRRRLSHQRQRTEAETAVSCRARNGRTRFGDRRLGIERQRRRILRRLHQGLRGHLVRQFRTDHRHSTVDWLKVEPVDDRLGGEPHQQRFPLALRGPRRNRRGLGRYPAQTRRRRRVHPLRRPLRRLPDELVSLNLADHRRIPRRDVNR